MGEVVKGYKVFNPDWTCLGFKYEVGCTYLLAGAPKLCDRGYHFCRNLADCFSYYSFDPNNKVAEIEARGEIDGNPETDDKCCTNNITIIRELTWGEVLELCNTGKGNSGSRNSGSRNSGSRNSGDWNSGDWNSGCFNTKEHTIYMFDKLSDWTLRQWNDSRARILLNSIPMAILDWVYESDMTDEEKEQNPDYKTTGGFLKMAEASKSAQEWWDGLSQTEKAHVLALPNFDADIFLKITGIDVRKGADEE